MKSEIKEKQYEGNRKGKFSCSCWGNRLTRQRDVMETNVARRPEMHGKCLLQTRPTAGRGDTYTEEDWVPDHCKKGEYRPSGLTTYGALAPV